MKILIAADLHIGANKFGVSDEKWSQPFAELVDYAIDNKMDAVAFAGDVFHHRRPTTWTSRFVAHQIQRLVSAEIYVLGADGNHDDGVSTDSVSAAWHLPKISQSEVIWASKRILSYTIGDVNIVLLPWVTPQAYDIATDLPLKEQLEAAQSEALRELSMLDETRTNILIGHAMEKTISHRRLVCNGRVKTSCLTTTLSLKDSTPCSWVTFTTRNRWATLAAVSLPIGVMPVR